MNKNTGHIPVMLAEVLDALKLKNVAHLQNEPDRPKYIDATLGAGGHTIEILKNGGSVLGIDADAKMISFAKSNISLAFPSSSDDRSFVATH